ncbi:MAG: thioredoxin-related protein [Candidatus Azotimanducaceae bacterium]|jgi:thioredoxin-related protein
MDIFVAQRRQRQGCGTHVLVRSKRCKGVGAPAKIGSRHWLSDVIFMRGTVLIFFFLLASCSNEQSHVESTGHPSLKLGLVSGSGTEPEIGPVGKNAIHWFDGTLEEAFKKSGKEGKPIFLYWGAIWCPPCQEIKHTVFKSSAFIELSELFVPVYLDGDTDRAQIWGEQFDVKGYPTMIVFSPKGEELTRIPGGIDVERYNSVLALALNEMRSTATLVSLARDEPTALKENDYQQLAYYSWWQDSVAMPEGVDQAALFLALSESAPAGPLSARFFMSYLSVLTQSALTEPALALHERTTLGVTDLAALETILSSDELSLACWDTLAYAAADILPLVSADRRDALRSKWLDQIFGLRHHASLSRAEQLAGWYPVLEGRLSDGQFEGLTPLSKADKQMLINELRVAEIATTDNYERQSVIYQVSSLYRSAGLISEARSLMLAELDRSKSPYYFMSSLSSLAEEQGDIEGALSWRRKAYERAEGEATRFQWGVSYVQTLIRLSPQSVEMINELSRKVIAGVSSPHALLAGRNFRRLEALSRAMWTWDPGSDTQEDSYMVTIQNICAGHPEDSLQARQCASLMHTDTKAQRVNIEVAG